MHSAPNNITRLRAHWSHALCTDKNWSSVLHSASNNFTNLRVHTGCMHYALTKTGIKVLRSAPNNFTNLRVHTGCMHSALIGTLTLGLDMRACMHAHK